MIAGWELCNAISPWLSAIAKKKSCFAAVNPCIFECECAYIVKTNVCVCLLRYEREVTGAGRKRMAYDSLGSNILLKSFIFFFFLSKRNHFFCRMVQQKCVCVCVCVCVTSRFT